MSTQVDMGFITSFNKLVINTLVTCFLSFVSIMESLYILFTPRGSHAEIRKDGRILKTACLERLYTEVKAESLFEAVNE
jgi:hypothetical protein